MKTRSKLLAPPAVAAAVVAATVAVGGASAAQDPAGATLTFQESDKGARFSIADVPPKSRGKGEPVLSLGDRVVAAVTGGTGAYAGARGTATSESGTTTVELLP